MSKTVTEELLKGIFLTFQVDQTLAEETTPYQKIGFYKTPSHGTLFMIDDTVMLTDRDEHVYHEMLAHVPLFSHPHPQRVLVIGGGDLGSLREILKHPTVKEVHLCEIDGRVIDLSKEHLAWARDAAEDSRAAIHVGDGFAFIQKPENRDRFDAILIDCTDAIGLQAQPQASQLFTSTFYAFVKQALAPGGIVVGQCESAFYDGKFIGKTYRQLSSDFEHVHMFTGSIQTYSGGLWCFYFASDAVCPLKDFREAEADRFCARAALKYYTPAMHRACFVLPAALEETLAAARDATVTSGV